MTWFKTLRNFLGLEKSEMCLCMVVSEQEGAEIWIKNKKTNSVTPKLVAIKKDHPVRITVKKIGHQPHSAIVRSSHNLTYYYCNLKRVPLKLISNESSRSASF